MFSKIALPLVFLLGLVAFTSCSPNKKTGVELNLAIWANYLSPEMAKKFTDETGIKLNISNYSSNEDLLAKIQSGASNIDVAVPSDYMVEILIKQNLIAELNKTLVPNLNGLDPKYLSRPYDPKNTFSLPYAWSTSGIAVNRELFQGKIESWKDVFESEALKGKISLMDDTREVIGAALKSNGASLNSVNPDEINKARETIIRAKKNVKLFTSDAIDILINKEVAVAEAYSSDAINAWNKSNGKIEYIIPKEGTSFAIDNIVILKNTKKIEAAHKLINFLLSEAANLNFVQTQFGGPVLKATRSKLNEKLKNNKALFPDSEIEKKFESIHDLGTATQLYDEAWLAIKTE
jgi:spermidine/putrescine transport system substrate-binding protein